MKIKFRSIFLVIVTVVMFSVLNSKNAYGDIEKYSIKLGQSIEIKILENHNSNYSWESEIQDNTIVELIHEEVIKNIKNDKGADRVHIFRFKSLENGESMIIFKLKKKGGVNEPVKLKTIVIEVGK